MNPVFAYIYGSLFGLAFAGAMVWIAERRDKKYRQGIYSFTDAFLPGLFWLLFSGGSNIAVMLRAPHLALEYNAGLLVFLAVYLAAKEISYRLRERRRNSRLKAEMRVIGRHSQIDPSNAVYFERASEIFEKLGEKDNALEAARRAAHLDPTVTNRWRIKQLEDSSGSGKGG